MATTQQETITKIQFRRGVTGDRQAATLSTGEPGWDTTQNILYIGDGQTPGGLPCINLGPGLKIGDDGVTLNFEGDSNSNAFLWDDFIAEFSDYLQENPTSTGAERWKQESANQLGTATLTGDGGLVKIQSTNIEDRGAELSNGLTLDDQGRLKLEVCETGGLELTNCGISVAAQQAIAKIHIGKHSNGINDAVAYVSQDDATEAVPASHTNIVDGHIEDGFQSLGDAVDFIRERVAANGKVHIIFHTNLEEELTRTHRYVIDNLSDLWFVDINFYNWYHTEKDIREASNEAYHIPSSAPLGTPKTITLKIPSGSPDGVGIQPFWFRGCTNIIMTGIKLVYELGSGNDFTLGWFIRLARGSHFWADNLQIDIITSAIKGIEYVFDVRDGSSCRLFPMKTWDGGTAQSRHGLLDPWRKGRVGSALELDLCGVPAVAGVAKLTNGALFISTMYGHNKGFATRTDASAISSTEGNRYIALEQDIPAIATKSDANEIPTTDASTFLPSSEVAAWLTCRLHFKQSSDGTDHTVRLGALVVCDNGSKVQIDGPITQSSSVTWASPLDHVSHAKTTNGNRDTVPFHAKAFNQVIIRQTFTPDSTDSSRTYGFPILPGQGNEDYPVGNAGTDFILGETSGGYTGNSTTGEWDLNDSRWTNRPGSAAEDNNPYQGGTADKISIYKSYWEGN